MRTTVDIPHPLYRKLKAKAARGRAIHPIVPSQRPGTLHIANEEI